MKKVTVNYSISNAENGFIVNKSIETETENDNSFSSNYTNETFVFNDWKSVIEFLSKAEEDAA